MLKFYINGQAIHYQGNQDKTLLSYLRDDLQITSAKDGCSGQGSCGACMVNINGKAKLACLIKLSKLENADIKTLEGLEAKRAETIAGAFVEKGAVQCGFCTPGIIMSANVLLKSKTQPTKEEILKNLKPHLCRCTGYVKIIEGIEYAGNLLKQDIPSRLDFEQKGIGQSLPKY